MLGEVLELLGERACVLKVVWGRRGLQDAAHSAPLASSVSQQVYGHVIGPASCPSYREVISAPSERQI